jgi:hypothetical protein
MGLPYLGTFFRRLMETGLYSDVKIVVHSREFRLHRCILCARSETLCDLFKSRWKWRDVIAINKPLVSPKEPHRHSGFSFSDRVRR